MIQDLSQLMPIYQGVDLLLTHQQLNNLILMGLKNFAGRHLHPQFFGDNIHN